jgi:hypothetical protein
MADSDRRRMTFAVRQLAASQIPRIADHDAKK